MDWRRAAIVVVCGLLALSACGSEAGQLPSQSSPDASLASTPWKLVHEDSRTLFVLTAAGDCFAFDHVKKDEDDTDIVLTALSRYNANAEVCTGEQALEIVAVCLERPLGDRELIHADLSPDWRGEKAISVSEAAIDAIDEPEPCPEASSG